MLWHGGADINIPVAMMTKAGERLKGSKVKVFEEETHMSCPVNHGEEIMQQLLASHP